MDAPDAEGRELPNLEAALEFARRNAIFTAAESLREKAHLVRSHRIDVEDAEGNVLDTVHFGDVVTIED